MSSINNNGNNYQNDDGAAPPNPEQLAQQHLAQEQRKNADKVLNANQKAKETNIIELVGMTPTDAANALNKTPLPKSNKYSAAGAVSNLPPPSAPKATVKPETQALYSSMHNDINRALGAAAQGEQAPNWSALSPQMHATNTQAEFDRAVEGHTTAAINTVGKAYQQFTKMCSGAMTMAFLMLRSESESDGVNINSQMGDIQSSLQQLDLKEQIKADKEAQTKLDKAAKKMAAMEKAGPIVMAIIAVLTVLILVATLGAGIGLAVTLVASLVGFVGGGAAGGAKKGKGFDIESAVLGMSIGSMIMPIGAVLGAMVKGLVMALEKLGMKAVVTGAKGATAKAMQTAGARAASGIAADATESATAGISQIKQALKGTSHLLTRQNARLLAVKEADAVVAAGNAPVRSLAATGEQVIAHIVEIMPAQLKALFSAGQSSVNSMRGMSELFKDMPAQKLAYIAENTLYMGQMVTGIAQASGNYAAAVKNNEAQAALVKGKFWGVCAQNAEDSFKSTQDFLSAVQDRHSAGIKECEQLLLSLYQVTSRAIANITA